MIWYVHGANSSPKSFNFIKASLPAHEHRDFSYDCETPLPKTIDAFVELLKGEDEPPHIISHSLGGVIALAASKRAEVGKIVTMSSPFGGSKVASLFRWIAASRLLDDIHVHSSTMVGLRHQSFADSDIMSFVTTSGGVFEGVTEANDGVVTIASQTALKGPDYITIASNHFEVLLCADVADKITDYLFDTPIFLSPSTFKLGLATLP